jgi:hypothetical protein
MGLSVLTVPGVATTLHDAAMAIPFTQRLLPDCSIDAEKPLPRDAIDENPVNLFRAGAAMKTAWLETLPARSHESTRAAARRNRKAKDNPWKTRPHQAKQHFP